MENQRIEDGSLDVWINNDSDIHTFPSDCNEIFRFGQSTGPHLLSLSSTSSSDYSFLGLDEDYTHNLVIDIDRYSESFQKFDTSLETQSVHEPEEEVFYNSIFLLKYEVPDDPAVGEDQTITLKEVQQHASPAPLNKARRKPVKIWECSVCKRRFRHHYILQRHLPIHSDERNFPCEECGKAFRQQSTLNQHMVIHSEERPFKCEICTKTFNRVSTLISHRKIHLSLKPYQCHICHKGFHQKGNLRNHIHTHTNERPYQCSVCLKGFNQMSNLSCHKRKAHPFDVVLPWKCSSCPIRFSSRANLRNHELRTHTVHEQQNNLTVYSNSNNSMSNYN